MRAKYLLLEGGLVWVAGFASSVIVTALWNLWKSGVIAPDWQTSLALAVGLAVALPLSHRFGGQLPSVSK